MLVLERAQERMGRLFPHEHEQHCSEELKTLKYMLQLQVFHVTFPSFLPHGSGWNCWPAAAPEAQEPSTSPLLIRDLALKFFLQQWESTKLLSQARCGCPTWVPPLRVCLLACKLVQPCGWKPASAGRCRGRTPKPWCRIASVKQYVQETSVPSCGVALGTLVYLLGAVLGSSAAICAFDDAF